MCIFVYVYICMWCMCVLSCMSVCVFVERLSGGGKKELSWNNVLEFFFLMILFNFILLIDVECRYNKIKSKINKNLAFKLVNNMCLIYVFYIGYLLKWIIILY